MVRRDRWWRYYGPHIVTDFQPGQVREKQTCPVEVGRVISYGTSSAGYDLRLCASGLRLFTAVHGLVNDAVIDPKKFDERCLITLEAEYDYRDSPDTYYTLPAHSYALGVTLETITMPKNHLGLVVGKSTYARCGLIVNTTPLEPGWTGQLVLELHNATPLPLRVYAREGIAQLLMLPIDMTPEVTYADRQGKYQGQTGITTARV